MNERRRGRVPGRARTGRRAAPAGRSIEELYRATRLAVLRASPGSNRLHELIEPRRFQSDETSPAGHPDARS